MLLPEHEISIPQWQFPNFLHAEPFAQLRQNIKQVKRELVGRWARGEEDNVYRELAISK